MPNRPRPDLDERFTLHPLEGEEVLRELLRDDPDGDEAEPDPQDGEVSRPSPPPQ